MGKKTKDKRPALTPGWVEYLRTSDEESQAPNRSQGYQHRLIMQNLIEPSGLPLLDTYSDIMSGKKINRFDYQRLLNDARVGKFSHVAVAMVDRFGRNDIEGMRAFDELRSLGITVRVGMYPSLEPEKADARMIVGLLFNVSAYESARTAERTREGMIETLQRGDWGWRAPDGYLNIEIRKADVEVTERLNHAKHKHAIATDPERFKVWREAFDLLLTDRYTLSAICEELHARGYKLCSGRPFVEVNKDGQRKTGAKYLSNAFHNWFYAGWLVVDNDWLTVQPKKIRGKWEALVSTEEFERGQAILRRRNENRAHQPRHFYLLQGLIHLERPDGTLRKLTCSTPHAGRMSGGIAYYCVPSSNLNFLCRDIDGQMDGWMRTVGIEEHYLPDIRRVFYSDVDRYLTSPNVHERLRLEKILKDIDDAELFFARQYQADKFSPENWERMSREWADQRVRVRAQLQSMNHDPAAQIASLDDALMIIAKAGILYQGMSPEGQQALLRLMVGKVVISPQGQIIRVEWQAPFGYLSRLIADNSGTTHSTGKARGVRKTKNQTSSGDAVGPTLVNVCAPTGLPRHKTLHCS